MTDKSRREFEAWCGIAGFDISRGHGGDYIEFDTDESWLAWQESRAAIEIDILEMKRNMESWNHDHISTPGYAMDALWRKHFGLNEAGKCDGEADVLSAK